MTNNITDRQLESSLERLNDSLGLAFGAYKEERDTRGGLVANAGTYVLDKSYGGVSLCRMCEGGGQSTVSGRGSKRECYTYISAMLDGIKAARQ
jgi:hypothetical protein